MLICICMISTLLAVLLPAISTANDDTKRLSVLKNIPQEKWSKIANGDEPWPEELFPLSIWSEEEKKKLPSEYWTKLERDERKWPMYINSQMKHFKREYGSDIKNPYDLYFMEQKQMKKSDYLKIAPPIIAKKTLKRLIDFTYLEAEHFSNLQGTPLKQIYVLSFKLGKLRIIPHDIIEFTKDNAVVLPSGPQANPKDGDNIFNNNDKLFFMVVDTGHQVERQYILEKYPGIKVLDEIEISYKKDKEIGWVYVAGFTSKLPPKSNFDYIQFCSETGPFFTPFALLQCRCIQKGKSILPTFDVCSRMIPPSVGGIPVDFQQGATMSMTVHPRPFGKITKTQKDFDMSLKAWYDGNVALYKRAAWKLKTPFGICTPIICADTVTVLFTLVAHTSWGVPFNPSILLKRVEFSGSERLNGRALNKDILKTNARFITPSNRNGVCVDGMMSEDEKKWDKSFKSWYVFSDGLSTSWCYRYKVDEAFLKNANIEVQWLDTSTEPGKMSFNFKMKSLPGKIGFSYVDGHLLPAFFNTDPENNNWGNLELILKRLDKPLTITINNKKITPKPYIHVPNIDNVKNNYRF